MQIIKKKVDQYEVLLFKDISHQLELVPNLITNRERVALSCAIHQRLKQVLCGAFTQKRLLNQFVFERSHFFISDERTLKQKGEFLLGQVKLSKLRQGQNFVRLEIT